jgi:hypothetical protein
VNAKTPQAQRALSGAIMAQWDDGFKPAGLESL